METIEPEPVITWLEDATVQIQVGDQIGWVSSSHLIEPKVKQLIKAYQQAKKD